MRFALHTWSLDTTPLPELLGVAAATGWDAVELRRVDFERRADAPALVRESGVRVAAVGTEPGWMFAQGPERTRLLGVLAEQCGHALRLGSPRLMSAADRGSGPPARAAANVRAAAEIAAAHGLMLVLEAGARAEMLNTIAAMRAVIEAAAHPACRLLVDSYHLQRSGDGVAALRIVTGPEIGYVQISDVPRDAAPDDYARRLPPGGGTVPFPVFFRALDTAGYAGDVSYEAPHPDAWARPPLDVAREALLACRRAADQA